MSLHTVPMSVPEYTPYRRRVLTEWRPRLIGGARMESLQLGSVCGSPQPTYHSGRGPASWLSAGWALTRSWSAWHAKRGAWSYQRCSGFTRSSTRASWSLWRGRPAPDHRPSSCRRLRRWSLRWIACWIGVWAGAGPSTWCAGVATLRLMIRGSRLAI